MRRVARDTPERVVGINVKNMNGRITCLCRQSPSLQRPRASFGNELGWLRWADVLQLSAFSPGLCVPLYANTCAKLTRACSMRKYKTAVMVVVVVCCKRHVRKVYYLCASALHMRETLRECVFLSACVLVCVVYEELARASGGIV